MTQYNCFECSGYQKDCNSFEPWKNKTRYYQGRCYSKDIAEHDLEKHSRGEKNITLMNMLEEYVKEGLR